MKRPGPLIILVFSLAVGFHYWFTTAIATKDSLFTQMLYLPSGKYLRPVAFGYDLMLADFVYLWSIQYYGDPGFHPRLNYLPHTYEIVTELDPQYLDAYQTGALFMFFEGRNWKAGLELLDRGFEKNPTQWILPADAGFYCMMTLKDYKRSAAYFEKAANVPGAPQQAKRMVAAMTFRAGDRVAAYRIWKEIYDTATGASIKQTAFHHVHDLKILIDLDALRKGVIRFREDTGRFPLNLDQLAAAEIISAVPVDPDGAPYIYNSNTGEVSSKAKVSLYRKYQ